MKQQRPLALPDAITTLLSFNLLPRASEVPGAVVLRYIPNQPAPFATHIRVDRNPLDPVFSDGGYFSDLREAHADWLSRVRFETRKHLRDLLPPSELQLSQQAAVSKAEKVADVLWDLYHDTKLNLTFAEFVEALSVLASRIGAGTIDQHIAATWQAARLNLSNLVESGGLFDIGDLP